MIARPRIREFWDAWQFAAVECGLALEAWLSAPEDEKELGYCAYLASLDREEQAATVLAEQLGRPLTASLPASA